MLTCSIPYEYTLRSEGYTLDKDVIFGAISCSRSTGRPRRRWTHDIEDWTRLKIKNSGERVGDWSVERTGPFCRQPLYLRMAHDMTWQHI